MRTSSSEVAWRPLGVVVPAPLPLAWSHSHAALPVVDAVQEGLRLYCSTRDNRGRSQIASGWLSLDNGTVDFDPEPSVAIGPLGGFDDSGVTSSCVVRHDGRILQYYTGWSLGVTVPFYLAIGCAVSDDEGRTFTKFSPAPILGRNTVDPLLCASPSVLVDNGLWRMWYVSATEWRLEDGKPQHRYLVKYAESENGFEWSPTGRVCIDFLGGETAISRPCVIEEAGLYRMWFSSRGNAYQIGYAESADGFTWERTTAVPLLPPASPSDWDVEMRAYPFVFEHRRHRHMLYNGNGFGATGIGHAVQP